MRRWPDATVLLAAVAVVGFIVPAPWWPTDRPLYERVGRELIVPGCSELHCFRPLVPWVLGLIPGSSILVWKLYAILCQFLAGIAMAAWCGRFGASRSAMTQCAWLTALGSGACYSLFDPYTADPLIHALVPTVLLLIARGNLVAATAVGGFGVLAKEFAAIPLVVSAVACAIRREWKDATVLALGAGVVIAVWIAWQVLARTAFGYSFGTGHSTEFASGAYLGFWLSVLHPRTVAAVIAMVFGGVWLLWAIGLGWGPRDLRTLTLASLPAMVIFNIVQQPDRALWNFAFLAMPAAAIVLTRVPPALGWLLVAAQVSLNLRYGGQLSFVPPSRVSLVAAIVIAAAIVVVGTRLPKPMPAVSR